MGLAFALALGLSVKVASSEMSCPLLSIITPVNFLLSALHGIIIVSFISLPL